MELDAAQRQHDANRGLSMAAVKSVWTIARVARDLGIDEDTLDEIAYPNLEPEDGRIRIHDVDREVVGFTDDGVGALMEIIADIYPHLLKS